MKLSGVRKRSARIWLSLAFKNWLLSGYGLLQLKTNYYLLLFCELGNTNSRLELNSISNWTQLHRQHLQMPCFFTLRWQTNCCISSADVQFSLLFAWLPTFFSEVKVVLIDSCSCNLLCLFLFNIPQCSLHITIAFLLIWKARLSSYTQDRVEL